MSGCAEGRFAAGYLKDWPAGRPRGAKRAILCCEHLRKCPPFEDAWLRGGPVRRWIPKGLAGLPAYVFETGGTTGGPKSRVAMNDFRIDYEMFSETLPD